MIDCFKAILEPVVPRDEDVATVSEENTLSLILNASERSNKSIIRVVDAIPNDVDRVGVLHKNPKSKWRIVCLVEAVAGNDVIENENVFCAIDNFRSGDFLFAGG